MRIITGKHRGRKIEVGPDKNIRPTSDFAREAIFNILSHGKLGLDHHAVVDQRVLDCFAGSGALGLEALSRGAAHATFIDKARDSISICRHNASSMKEDANCAFLPADASKLGPSASPYGLVFIDPPYFSKLIEPTLESLHKGKWLAEDAILVLEHDEKESVKLPEHFEKLYERRYGRAIIEVVKYSPLALS
ncbi:MAG: 16S rRNA (guanine(966)-N(2))-methyltransferase RsmD [Alphaproteobacteria bacterium]|nr:16S rRNA (guanine(966)-N(2))-methyltransferase RsmD [Alphaproteobacteria bacterium]